MSKSILCGRMVAMMTCGCGIATRENGNKNIAILSCKSCVNAIVIRPSPVPPARLCWLEAVGPQLGLRLYSLKQGSNNLRPNRMVLCKQ